MATVYLARSEGAGGFEREVAVKLVHAEDSDHDTLLREARLAARIHHPNVVAVLDAGVDTEGVFLVMDYIAGESLAGLRRLAERAKTPIPQPVAIRILCDTLAGLHAAHELVDDNGSTLGLVHRDVSPHNLLIGTDGVTRLTDFGIAKIAHSTGQTRSGVIKGKIGYLSPEQGRGHPLDRRSDVWSAGVVAWELLSGRRLCETKDELMYLVQLMSQDPPLLRSLRPELPEALERAVASALTRDIGKRCPSAAVLRARLLDACPECADATEVGELVRELVGPRLQQRQQRARQIERLRAKMSLLVSEQADGDGSGPTNPNLDVSLTSPPSSDESPALSTTARSGPRRSRRRGLLAAVLGLGALGSIGVLAAARAGDSGSTATVTAQPPVSLELPVPPPPAATTEPPSRGAERRLRVKSSVAISELQIGSQEFAFASPVTLTEVKLSGARPGDAVHAVSVDGRRVVAALPPDDDLALRFPPKTPLRRKPAAEAVPPSGDPPLANNPYPR
jgi:serine/threonine-protein kinase